MSKAAKQFIVINIILGVLALSLMVVYLLQQNSITSRGYEVESLNFALKKANNLYNNLIIQKASLDHITEIEVFAQQAGMVEAGEVIYIYESGKVALKKL